MAKQSYTRRDAARAVEAFMQRLVQRNPGEPEFHQAVRDVAASVAPHILANEELRSARILERMTEPERIVIFRVPWETDDGEVRTNRGWRVQFNGALGAYKGGLRFHPTVNQSVLKFLGFEQTLKNALTGLPMGGAKGGADFDPKGRSDREVMRFCQSFMIELRRHIGEDTDVPAGDIGVGDREIGYLFGMLRRIENRFTGAITGKGEAYSGSPLRAEATGYGCVLFAEMMLTESGDGLRGKRIAISGSGNVALFAAEKATELGATVVTMSDSDGFVHDPDGFDRDKIERVKDLKQRRRGRIEEHAKKHRKATFTRGESPWSAAVECDVALPCATQNELSGAHAKRMIKAGVRAVVEGANMPCEHDAIEAFRAGRVLVGPAKAANAGGVAVSGLERAQNASHTPWDRDTVERRLEEIMRHIHDQCVRDGRGREMHVDYVRGANLAGFKLVAAAMLAQGIV